MFSTSKHDRLLGEWNISKEDEIGHNNKKLLASLRSLFQRTLKKENVHTPSLQKRKPKKRVSKLLQKAEISMHYFANIHVQVN